MRVFFSEYRAVYASYTFSYAVYCLPESEVELPRVYESGFLPYSGNPALPGTMFYLARSVRLDLRRFVDCSENRRVDRKASRLGIEMEVRPKHAFPIDSPHLLTFCVNFAEVRFGPGAMDRARLQYILNRGCLSHVFVFSQAERHIGYVLAILQGSLLHYWFAFYDLHLMRRVPLGKWMMWRAIRWAQECGLDYLYLGTCYGTRSLYKIRDHGGAEFFDGVAWNRDIALLKKLCAADDHQGRVRDRFKEEGFPDAALVPPSP